MARMKKLSYQLLKTRWQDLLVSHKRRMDLISSITLVAQHRGLIPTCKLHPLEIKIMPHHLEGWPVSLAVSKRPSISNHNLKHSNNSNCNTSYNSNSKPCRCMEWEIRATRIWVYQGHNRTIQTIPLVLLPC